VKLFVLAWQFLTILPLGRAAHEPSQDELARSMVFYPVVGLLLGLILAMFEQGLSSWVSRPLMAFLLIALGALLTGGLHLDGFADTVDGLAGGRNKEEILHIMRDGRIGALAVVALILLLGVRYQALAEMPARFLAPALIVMPVVGRAVMVFATALSPYARKDEGLAKPFIEHQSPVVVAIVALLTLTATVFFFQLRGLVLVGVLALAVVGMVAYCRRRCGGITGDILGALNEVTEVLFLIGLPLVMRR
jgi:adenosylcobinamide-GDP ribazoletransferase